MHEAFLADRNLNGHIRHRQTDAIIVLDSESEDSEALTDLKSERSRHLINKRRVKIKWEARYLKAKRIAEQTFLARKPSQKVRGILKEFPQIGQEIEKFVQERNIVADKWRRTGVLTFGGNTNVKQKVTLGCIRQLCSSCTRGPLLWVQWSSYAFLEIATENQPFAINLQLE